MVFRVMNDGHQADLEVIQRILYPAEDVKPKSYGIKNVNDRLRHQYGEEYTLQYRIQGDLTGGRDPNPVGKNRRRSLWRGK